MQGELKQFVNDNGRHVKLQDLISDCLFELLSKVAAECSRAFNLSASILVLRMSKLSAACSMYMREFIMASGDVIGGTLDVATDAMNPG